MILKAGGNVVYIVPTLSLVSQVCSDFNAALKNFGLLHYGISTTFNIQEANNNKINSKYLSSMSPAYAIM